MKKLNILIVEDEALNAIYLKLILEKIGHEVIKIITSGEQTLKELPDLNPDLIMMDVFLNGTLTGIETVKKIHIQKKVPIIYVTASQDEKTHQAAQATEMAGYIIKPFNEETVLKHLKKIEKN